MRIAAVGFQDRNYCKRHMRFHFSIALFLILIPVRVYGESRSHGKIRGTVVHVYDGDTVKLDIRGQETRVRLIGIDAPEMHDNPKAVRDAARSHRDLEAIMAAGRKSLQNLNRILPRGTEVTVEQDVQPRDTFGRMLAYVFLRDGTLLNELLVREGYAGLMTYPPNTKYVERLRSALVDARSREIGLWAGDCGVIPNFDKQRK